MATIEKRVQDLEYIIAHLPEDLDARFAGVDYKLAGIREVQALHTTRFTTIEKLIADKVDDVKATLSAQLAEIKALITQG
ncbi:MAG: hypothetical protein ACK4TP_10225 [Hyphomicrobium sp.]